MYKLQEISAPIAQWIEHFPAKEGIQVRFLLGAFLYDDAVVKSVVIFQVFTRENEKSNKWDTH